MTNRNIDIILLNMKLKQNKSKDPWWSYVVITFIIYTIIYFFANGL